MVFSRKPQMALPASWERRGEAVVDLLGFVILPARRSVPTNMTVF